jgi:hypothetical protein
MPGVMAGGYRTVSFDGCKTVKVPDTPANRARLGKMKASPGVTGYPVIQLMALVETGTRSLLGAAFGSAAAGELDWARKLLHLLDATMLVLMDRGFDAGDFPAEVAGAGAQFPVRLNASRRPPVLRHLPDGSFTSVIGGVKVRVIAITDPDDDLTGDIGRAVLARLNPPRRPRVCPRRVKSPLSRWNKHPPGKPTASKNITQITSRPIPADHERVTRRPKTVTNPERGSPSPTPLRPCQSLRGNPIRSRFRSPWKRPK